jgi:hypothetical protein
MHDFQDNSTDQANHGDSSPGELIIGGTRYGKKKRVAEIFDRSERTIDRWVALRIGPPRIKIGKLILFNLDRLPEWLAQHEEQRSNRRAGHWQGRAGR